jgi:hypothetical protein
MNDVKPKPSGAAVPAATVLQASRLQAPASPSETLGGLGQARTPAPLVSSALSRFPSVFIVSLWSKISSTEPRWTQRFNFPAETIATP